MNEPMLIFVAAVVLVTVVAVAWLLAEASGRLAPRPRIRGVLFVALGAAYLVSAAWETGRAVALTLRIAMGVLWVGLGSREFRRRELDAAD
ncbi:MAG TPA: hypothetical protein VGE86_07435 [Thermoanaerobaculia bacterium]